MAMYKMVFHDIEHVCMHEMFYNFFSPLEMPIV